MVRPVLSKAAETKDRHQSKHWPGSSAGPNKNKLTGDEELDYEERAAEDARRELEETRREDATAVDDATGTSEGKSAGAASESNSNSSTDTSSTPASAA